MPEQEMTSAEDVKVVADKAAGDYTIKNPNSTGCKTCLSGGTTLNEWDIEDEKFYENEGKQIGTRNLWASIPNLLLGFAVWLMWSVTIAKIQKAHSNDPSVYYFKDFAPEIEGVSEGFRGCPGWYLPSCCNTWKNADQEAFDAWQVQAKAADATWDESVTFKTADEFMMSPTFHKMKNAPKGDAATGFSNYTSHGVAFGCPTNPARVKAYKGVAFVISATAGLAGGIFRLPNSFIVPLVGGRNVVYFTSILLAIPCAWAAIALSSPDVPAILIVLAAMFSGVGGGAFASSMANINPFFPRRRSGYALGMNGGLGNLGVSLCQLFLGNVLMAYGPESTAIGGFWVPQGGWFLFPLCLVFSLVAFLWMNNLPKSVHDVPDNFFFMFGRYASLQGPAYIASLVGVGIVYGTRTLTKPEEAIPLTIVTIIAVCLVEHVFIWFLSTPAAKPGLKKQIAIFKDKHNYWMTYLYIMTFGSFIGFSSAFPKLIIDLFDEYGEDDCARLQALPSDHADFKESGDCSFTGWPVKGFSPAFLGALIGSLIRPLGGMMSDKFGGARVTHYHTLLMVLVTAALGVIVKFAREAKTGRMDYFPPFFLCFMILFYCTGVGNGSTFRQIAIIFDKTLAPPVLGWSSAIASFGAFLIPKFFATAIQAGTPENPFFIFAAYYLTCLVVNWWFYFRKGCEKPC